MHLKIIREQLTRFTYDDTNLIILTSTGYL